MIEKQIKDSHVLVLASGPNLKKYWGRIEEFIKENDVVTFGCNYITDFIIPDYHFWGSWKRWIKYSKFIDAEKSVLILSENSKKNKVHNKLLKQWGGKYTIFKEVKRRWEFGSEDKKSEQYKKCEVCYRGGTMYGCFFDISTKAIFYAYIKGASKITVVGSDGYTFYSKNDLKKNKVSQHCYGEGLTDGFTYAYCKRKDWDKYKTLRLLHKYGKKQYGFGFEIITPTIYEEFYNPDVLNIGSDFSYQKWKEPKPDEYKKLYFDCLKNRKMTDPKY